MFKQQLIWFGRALGSLKAAAIIFLGTSALSSYAAPANDNFANAYIVTGLSGTTNGNNAQATSEPGEPVDAGVGGGKTIWYQWTATASSTMIFNTEGSDFDTALAVYTGNAVNGLTLLAQNDDVAFPGDLTSKTTFPVVAGTTYFIQVDGNEGDSGDVILNWSSTGAFSMGSFGFAAGGRTARIGRQTYPLYVVGENDSFFGTGPSAPWMTDLGVRARVVRTGGTAGKLGVYYSITNTSYTNFLITNVFGTNITYSNIVTHSLSNVVFTNFVSFNQYQNFVNGAFTYCSIQSNAYTVAGTNVTGFTPPPLSVTQLGTNLPVIVCGNFTNSGFVTNGTDIFSTMTNLFCTNISLTNIVPTASANTNYLAQSGTLPFIDFQIGADLSYLISPGATVADPKAIVNHVVIINLVSNVFDPLESTNLAPPSITAGSAYVEILNAQGTFDNPCSTAPIIGEFAKAVNWIPELDTSAPIVNQNPNQRTARIYAVRSGTDPSQTLTLNVLADAQPTIPFNTLNRYNTFPLQPGSDYATPPSSTPVSKYTNHFELETTSVTWSANDPNPIKPIDLTIYYDPNVQFNEDIIVQLYNPTGATQGDPQLGVGQLNTTTLTILFKDQPAGAVDQNHNPDANQNTVPPYNSFPGAGGSNNTVYAAIVQPNNQTLFSGDFRAYNTVPQNRIARMNADGSLDTTFLAAPNSGANDTITCMALQSDGRIIIGGVFTSFNGTNRFHIARLNSDGSLDPNFNTGVGINGTVSAMALQADGKVIIGGNFTSVNSTNANFVARLNTNGSLDTNFSVGIGPNGEVKALALQSNGAVVIGGLFTSIDNRTFSYIARLNTNGTLDTNFNPGFGADQPVYALAEQTDGKVVVGGAFATINLTSRNYITRLNGDGSIDHTFDVGTGPDGVVYSLAVQTDGNILVGGLFTSINGTRRIGLSRLLSYGPVDTSFLDTAYNQFAGFINNYNNPNVQQRNAIFTIALQQDGNVIVGGRFSQAGGGGTRDAIRPRENITRLIGNATPGPGNIALTYTNYTADKSGGAFYVTMSRNNGALGPASATLQPNPLHSGTGNAIPNQDYQQAVLTPTWGTTWSALTWAASDDFTGPNYQPLDVVGRFYTPGLSGFSINILDNPATSGNLGLDLQVTQPTGSLVLGGEPIPTGVALGNSSAPLTIVDDDITPGTLVFSQPVYTVNENGTNATITVIRTNGASGTVTVQYQTLPGTALPGATNDYISVSNTLTFFSGDTIKTYTIPIVNNFVVRPDRVLTNILFNPTGGATIGYPSNAALIIINDNFLPGMLSFTSPTFTAQQLDGTAVISVGRTGGNQGTESIAFSTADGTAIGNLDYIPTNGVLTWNNNDTSNKTFTVKLLNSGLVGTNATINLRLSNAIVNGTANTNALGLYTNAVLTVSNNNHFGSPTLSASSYYVNESAGVAVITVNRLGGSAQTITVDYATSDGTAQSATTPNDYTAVSGTLTFTNGQFSQSFTVPITDNTTQTNNGTYFTVTLSNPTPNGVTFGAISSAPVYIIADQVQDQPPGSTDTTFNPSAGFNANVYALLLQPNGSLVAGGDFTQANGIARNHIARLDANGLLDVKFSSGTSGANASVRALALQTDGQILVGGLFSTMNGINENYVARLNYDGSLDSSFNTGGGADNPVYAIAETFVGGTNTANRRIIIGGSFASVNGIPFRSFAQLNQDGSVDTTYTASGANGTVYAIAVYSTNDVNAGKVLIAGDFTSVNGTNVNHIARLNPNGSLDTTFNNINLGSGPNDSVRALAIQLDGKIVIGGLFTAVSGNSANFIARLDSFGQPDAGFNVGVGANNAVTALAIQQDLKIVVGGSFSQANGVTRNRLTRLNPDGTVDAGINFGIGANDFVDAIAVQQNNQIVFAGGFTQFDGLSKPHINRIFGGTETGSGTVQFVSGNFQVNQGTTNIVIGIQRIGGTGYSGPGGYSGPVNVVFSTSDGTAVSGTDYIGLTNTITFQVGETFQSVVIPILTDPLNLGELTANLSLTDPANGDPATFAQLGNQSTAVLNIVGANSTVSYSAANYSVNKNIGSGEALITVTRNYSSVGTASIDYTTTSNGTATAGLDYTPVNGTLFFADGQSTQTFLIPIISNGLSEGNVTVGLALNNPTNTALDTSLPITATLTILDNVQAPGNLAFSMANYSVLQTGTNITITVLRTNGSVGAVSVNYSTSGGTATGGKDYTPVTGQLAFIDGQTSNSFVVPILNNTNLTSDVTVNLVLLQPTGGAGLTSPSNAVLTIQNQNFDLGFAQAGYFVDEQNGSVTVGVTRTGSTNGTLQVNYATTNGSALSGVNYTAASGTLTFLPGQTFESFTIPIVYDPLITGDLIFFVNLFKTNASVVQLVTPTTTVTVLDDDTGFAFLSASNSVVKGTGNAIITVVRIGKSSGTAQLGFATSGGTAAANVEYVPTNGILNFLAGQTSNTFAVKILNDNTVDGTQTVNLALSNPSSGSLIAPSNSVLSIFDNESGISFSSATYSVNENAGSATITVLRTGVLTNTVSVAYSTANGTASSNSQYTATSGILTFTNGQTSATFGVSITDNNVTGGSETVLLQLANPSTNATLIAPAAATLTILNNDGSLILAAGSAVLAPTNGVIYANTNVTVLLSLLNSGGSTATNVTATLLATNGVTPTGTTTQNYGNLLVNGPSVFRQFTFNTGGTNGGTINAVLQLHYGTTNTSLVSFTYSLGSSTNYYTNNSIITINDNAPASPYPSVINVASQLGVINKITATVSNLGHSYISDVVMLLVGPAGQKELLMDQNGGAHVITNVTLTFDSTAGAGLTTNAPATGTYLPALQTNQFFYISSGNVSAPAGPYVNSLTNFNGSNPNGAWQLFVEDIKQYDSGAINGGWGITISTLNVVAPNVDLVLGLTGSPSPVIASNVLTYVVSVTNAGPSTATSVIVTNALPAGVINVGAIASQGSCVVSNGMVICSLGSLVTNATASVTITVTPTNSAAGLLTNTATASCAQVEDNPSNNSATVITPINSASADLAIGVSVAPQPAFLGNNITYTVSVTNLGPSPSTGIFVTNTLAAGATLISSTAASTVTNAGGFITFGVPNLNASGVSSFSFVVKPAGASTNLTAFGVFATVFDPLKGNNSASVRTIVQYLPLAIAKSGSSLTFRFPASGSNYVLQMATNLPTGNWVTLTNLPTLSGGTNTITVATPSRTEFFRLISQ